MKKYSISSISSVLFLVLFMTSLGAQAEENNDYAKNKWQALKELSVWLPSGAGFAEPPPISVNNLLIWSGRIEDQGDKKIHHINECVKHLSLQLKNGSHDDWPNRDWNIIDGGKISSASQKIVFGNDDNSNEVKVYLKIDQTKTKKRARKERKGSCVFVKSISLQPTDSSSGSGGGDFSISYTFTFKNK